MNDILNFNFEQKRFLNINFPCCNPKLVKSKIFTRCDHQKISDIIKLDDDKGFFEIGKMNVKSEDDLLNDNNAIKDNFISLTPLSINLTDECFFNE